MQIESRRLMRSRQRARDQGVSAGAGVESRRVASRRGPGGVGRRTRWKEHFYATDEFQVEIHYTLVWYPVTRTLYGKMKTAWQANVFFLGDYYNVVGE